LLNTVEAAVAIPVVGAAAASMAVAEEGVLSTAAEVLTAAVARTVVDESTAAVNIEAARLEDPEGWLGVRAGCRDEVEQLDRDAATAPRLIARRIFVRRSTTGSGIRSGMAGALRAAARLVRLARVRT
jgi:hypothetical protein